MKFSDIKDLAIVAGIGVAAYLLWKNKDKFNPTSDKNLAYQAANDLFGTDSLGASFYNAAYEWWHGNDGTGESTYLMVNFPDNSRHAIGASEVDNNGYFVFEDISYRLANDANHQHFAIPV